MPISGSRLEKILKEGFHFLQTLALGTQPPCCAMSKTHEEAILQALQSTSQLNSQPASTAIDGNEPSWMFCPAEFSDDSNPPIGLQIHETFIQKQPAESSWPKKHEIINCSFNLLCFRMKCYIAIGNWDNNQD